MSLTLLIGMGSQVYILYSSYQLKIPVRTLSTDDLEGFVPELKLYIMKY